MLKSIAPLILRMYLIALIVSFFIANSVRIIINQTHDNNHVIITEFYDEP
jgi:hypothetical protein